MDKVYTTHEVAKYCQVTMTTVVNWVKDGSLKAYKTKGGHRRVHKKDLMDFLAKHNMPMSTKERILIVDDDESIRLGLKKLFESKGFEVDTASNGFVAGSLVEANRPALVVLDLVMPGLDGFEVCRHIKEKMGLKQTKVIVLTGYPSKVNFSKAKQVGADRCIAKPASNKDLLMEIENLLGKALI